MTTQSEKNYLKEVDLGFLEEEARASQDDLFRPPQAFPLSEGRYPPQLPLGGMADLTLELRHARKNCNKM